LRVLKKYVSNSMDVIRMPPTASVGCFTAINKSSPVASWDRVKCPLDAHFRISSEVEGHWVLFPIPFYEYYKFGHIAHFMFGFSPTLLKIKVQNVFF